MQTLRRQRKQRFTEILMKYYVGINDDVLNELLDAAESRTERKTDDLQGEYITSIETAIQADVPVTNEIMDGLKTQSAAIMAFESAFGITSSSWAGKWHSGKPEWTRLRKWVVGVWQERPTCFDEYVAFKKGDGKFFGLMDATQIARKPDDFYTSWDVFVRECAPPVEHTSNYYQPEDDSQFVPNPRTK